MKWSTGKAAHWGWVSLAAATLGATLQTACIQKAEKTTVDPASDPSSPTYNPPVGVVDDSAGFYVRAMATSDYTTYTHLGTSSDYTSSGSFNYTSTKCTVDPAETDIAKRDVLCYIEAEELDLYFHGLSMQYNVPSTMCAYFEFMPPYYFVLPAGTGPIAAQYYTNAAGNFVDEGNAPGGQATCLYDYSKYDLLQGPNCCVGKYSTVSGAYDPVTTMVKYSPAVAGVWGGKIANCLGGPAMATQKIDAGGFPMADLYFIQGSGRNAEYKVEAPINKSKGSNVYVANYFASTTDYHTPNAQFPAAVRNASNAIVPANAVEFTAADHTSYGGSTNPYYSFTCYDRNREAKARVRLMVRSWDMASFAGIATGYVATPGNEPSYGGPYHDFGIWEDFKGAAATYLQGYPGFAE